MAQATLASARSELAERLRFRKGEIETAAMTRLYGVASPPGSPDPEYVEGLRRAASAALRYLLEGVDRDESRLPEVPAEVLVQSRLAARCKVPLDTVVRRCLAGYALFGDFLMEEVEAAALKSASVKQLLRVQAALFDRLVSAVTEEYNREAAVRPDSGAKRRAELVERLLAGEPLETTELAYEIEAMTHLGLIAQGEGAEEALRQLAKALDRRLLLISREEEIIWAWLGGRKAPSPKDVARFTKSWPPSISLAIGEPSLGLEGWRLTHRQAQAALPIALRSPQVLTRYGDVALLAAVFQDDLLATSLQEIYLAPLEGGRDGGEVARETLRAYFAAERNVSSTAMALGVNRNTVASRLRAIEEKLGRPLGRCAAEFEVALRLKELTLSPSARPL